MHAVGIHSAMAIKRQRKRRDEQKRARERRYSTQSSESGETFHSPSGSVRRKSNHPHHAVKPGMLDSQVCNRIGINIHAMNLMEMDIMILSNVE